MNTFSKIYTSITGLLYFAALALFIVAPEYISFVLGVLGGAFFLSALFAFKKRREIIQFLRSRLFKNLAMHTLNMTLIISVLGMINFLVLKNDYFLDITQTRLHVLSDQSKKALQLLGKESIKFELFAKREGWNRFSGLLNLYKNAEANITLQFYDIDKEVALVQLNDIKENGTLVIEYKGRTYKTVAQNELAVTNLLLKIFNPQTKKIYYSTGHNEMSLDDKSSLGGNFLKEKILNSNFELEPIELQNGVPSDARGLMILNPQIEFLPAEIGAIRGYLTSGGALLTTLSPHFNGVLIKNYTNLLSEFGAIFRNVLILDRLAVRQGSQASIPVVNSYNSLHEITKEMRDRTIFPVSGALEIQTEKLFKWESLAKSTPFPGSWGEVSFEEVKTGKAKYNEKIDLKGPLSIILAGENKKSRIVVYSSASFISNQFQGQSNNFNLFLNSLSWMLRDEALLSLGRPQLEGNLVYISSIQLSLIFYFSIVFFPFLFFGLGVYHYRKKLGS